MIESKYLCDLCREYYDKQQLDKELIGVQWKGDVTLKRNVLVKSLSAIHSNRHLCVKCIKDISNFANNLGLSS